MVYAGYPADLNKVCVSWNSFYIKELFFYDAIICITGASGAVVFDNKGRIVGVLSAIKVGYHGLSPYPQLHGTFVFVNRLRQL